MTHEEMSEQTKNLLAITLKQTLETKPLGKISISDIVKTCDVNRQTFYYHFKDIFELLDWMYVKELEDYESERPALTANYHDGIFEDNLHDVLYYMIHYIEKNFNLCKNVMDSNAHEKFEIFLQGNIIKNLKIGIYALYEYADKEPDDEYIDQIAHFYALSEIAIIKSWMKEEIAMDTDQFIASLESIVAILFRGILSTL